MVQYRSIKGETDLSNQLRLIEHFVSGGGYFTLNVNEGQQTSQGLLFLARVLEKMHNPELTNAVYLPKI